MQQSDLSIKNLGACKVHSPIKEHKGYSKSFHFVNSNERVIFDVISDKTSPGNGAEPLTLEQAGPEKMIYFDPSKTSVAIVTCGGLCPGVNNVIRSIVMTLWYRYGVRRILGVQYGYRGFIAEYGHPFVDLDPEEVSDIYQFGGTVLGSSRGAQDVGEIVDCLQRNGINILFTIGGDGTLKGALAIHREIEKRGLKIVVAGIPKTIDNDINYIEKTFGFETSFTIASPIIRDAHNEAKGVYNGIAIVKLMGRDSGFIAANAALAIPEVNFVLVPEIDFDLHGKNGLLEIIRKRMESKKHCMIVVAEGAGQHLFDKTEIRKDSSGNILHNDIGIFLKNQIKNHFNELGIGITVKYIDPSYIIRSAPANASDSIFCNGLGLNGVHSAMAGKTSFVTGLRNNHFVNLPIELVTSQRKKIDITSDLWLNVLETTGQPSNMKNETLEDELAEIK